MIKARCDIVIPVFNGLELTKNCLANIYENTKDSFNLILIDNASGLKTKDYLENFRSTNINVSLVRNDDNTGWVKAVNQGMRLSASPYICIMNNDTIVKTQDWLGALIRIAELEHDIGLVNPHFKLKKDAGWKDDRPFVEVDFCRGYCILIKRAVIEKIGMLDESYGLGYYDDNDYSVRAIRAGFRCVKANGVLVEHIRDSTFSAIFKGRERLALNAKNKELFYSRWGRKLQVLFVITKGADRNALSHILLSLARRQHMVYIWNSRETFGLAHTSIRETSFGRFLPYFIFSPMLYLNGLGKASKRYDIVFTDSTTLPTRLPVANSIVRYIDIEKDIADIHRIVDSAARGEHAL